MRIPYITTNLQYVTAFTAGLTYFMSGMLTGWPSPMLPRLQQPGSRLLLTAGEASWVVSTITISAILPLMVTPLLVDFVARKPLLAFSALPIFASWLMVLFADSAGVLIGARLVAGLGLGGVVCVLPMYVGEVAEARVRGALGTVFQLMMAAGTLLEYSIGPYMSYEAVAIVSAAVPVAFLLLFVWMPESPYFLAMRGRDKDAQDALKRLRGTVSEFALKEEMDIIHKVVEEQRKSARPPLQLLRQLFCQRGSRRALLVCVVLILAQVFTGLATLTGYTTEVFQQSGAALDPDVCAIVVAAVQALSSVATSLLVDRAGRRPLLLLSFAGCALMMAAMATVYYLDDAVHADLSAVQWMPLTTFVAYLVFNMLGVGPLPWAIAGEVFPSEVKGLATAVVSIVQSVAYSTLSRLFQVVSDAAGMHSIFFVFAGSASAGFFFTFFFVFETKGRSFLEITRRFEGRKDAAPNDPSAVLEPCEGPL